jgi:hypothetical protein
MLLNEAALFDAYFSPGDRPQWLGPGTNASAVRAWRAALTAAAADSSEAWLLISANETQALLGPEHNSYVPTAYRSRFIARWNNGEEESMPDAWMLVCR